MVRSSVPEARSQSLIVSLSTLADASRRPSGEKASFKSPYGLSCSSVYIGVKATGESSGKVDAVSGRPSLRSGASGGAAGGGLGPTSFDALFARDCVGSGRTSLGGFAGNIGSGLGR